MEVMDPDNALDDLRARVAHLETDLGSRVAQLERQLAALGAPPIAARRAGDAVAADRRPPASDRPPVPPPPRPGDRIGPPPPTAPPVPATRESPTRSYDITVESVLRWAGISLVVLSALFLVSTAIDRGWVSPEVQLLGAFLIGLGLLATALRLVDERRSWALALGNGGAAVIIVCAGAGYSWLELYEPLTALGFVVVATAISLLAAVRLRLEAVAITASAAMLVVPTFARIIADGPVPATGIWLGASAVAAMVVGLERCWPLYRLVATWAAAAWVVGLAAYLSSENDTDHLVSGLMLVAVVTAVLWLSPGLSAVRGPDVRLADALVALEHRSAVAVPLWTWLSALSFSGLDIDSPGGWIGLAIAAGFLVVAVVAGLVAGWVDEPALISHLLGAGLLVTVASVAWLGGPLLVVVLTAQAVATLVVATRFSDRLLTANGYGLAAIGWSILLVDMVDTIERGEFVVGDTAAHAASVVALAVIARLTARQRVPPFAELVNGVAWAAGLVFVASVLSPVVVERGWLAVGVGLAAASALGSGRLGRYVLAQGLVIAGITVVVAAFSIVGAAVDGTTVGGHLANLSVVAGLVALTAWLWRLEQRPDLARPSFVLTWVAALAWPASVFLGELPGPQDQVAISATWALAAAGALVAGVLAGDWTVRVVGLTTLGTVLAKLLTVDLAEIDTLWRVGLFLVIGLGLLRLGYALPALGERFGHRGGEATGRTGAEVGDDGASGGRDDDPDPPVRGPGSTVVD